jgi:hypothetical protein
MEKIDQCYGEGDYNKCLNDVVPLNQFGALIPPTLLGPMQPLVAHVSRELQISDNYWCCGIRAGFDASTLSFSACFSHLQQLIL